MGNKATAIFDADDSALQQAFRRIDRRLLDVQAKFSNAAAFGAKMFAAPAAGALLLGGGIYKALDVGGHLADVRKNTGLAVDEAAILEQEFRGGGKAAEDVQPVIAKMLKTIADGTADDMVKRLGVNLEELKSKTPLQQFQMLGKSIADLKTPAERIAASTAIFGKSGASLVGMFTDNDFGGASRAVGSQAEILNRNADLFDSAGDKLALTGLKLQGFMVGVADRVVPVLMPLLDRLEAFDAAPTGQAVGDSIAMWIEAMASGRTGELVGNSMKQGISSAIAFMLESGADVSAQIGMALPMAVVVGGNTMFPLIAALGDELYGQGQRFVGVLVDGVADVVSSLQGTPLLGKHAEAISEKLRRVADNLYATGDARASSSSVTGVLGGAALSYDAVLGSAGKSAAGSVKKLLADDMRIINGQLGRTVNGIMNNVDKQQASALAAMGLPQYGSSELGTKSNSKAWAGDVDSLADVGGAWGRAFFSGFGSNQDVADPQLVAAQETNELLRDIRDQMGVPQGEGERKSGGLTFQ